MYSFRDVTYTRHVDDRLRSSCGIGICIVAAVYSTSARSSVCQAPLGTVVLFGWMTMIRRLWRTVGCSGGRWWSGVALLLMGVEGVV